MKSLWNALCWIGEEGDDCPAFRLTEPVFTRWACGIRYELCALVERLSVWGWRVRVRWVA